MARIVSKADLVKVKRGRKAEIDGDLVATLKGLKAGQAVILDAEFGEVPRERRSTVSAVIRRHWSEARSGKASVSYSPEGFAQVEAAE